LNETGDLEGEWQMAAFVCADFDAINIQRAIIAGRAYPNKDALPLPGCGDIHAAHIPGKIEVIEDVLILLIPTGWHCDWACVGQAIEPPIALTNLVWVDLKIPYSRKVELVAYIILDGVEHVLLLCNISVGKAAILPPSYIATKPPFRSGIIELFILAVAGYCMHFVDEEETHE
jgi:hypothetical protein